MAWRKLGTWLGLVMLATCSERANTERFTAVLLGVMFELLVVPLSGFRPEEFVTAADCVALDPDKLTQVLVGV